MRFYSIGVKILGLPLDLQPSDISSGAGAKTKTTSKSTLSKVTLNVQPWEGFGLVKQYLLNVK